MALIINGTTIPTTGNYINYNSTNLTEVKYNEVSVWKKITFATKEYGYTGGMQSCYVYGPGLYKLEVWGSRGVPSGAYGGYSCRYYLFNADTTIYICVGGIAQLLASVHIMVEDMRIIIK